MEMRAEYNGYFETVHRFCAEADKMLTMMYVVLMSHKSEDMVKRLITNVRCLFPHFSLLCVLIRWDW